ncbi:hypothetical protein [Cellulomonas sp. SG140]|uniref:hypothetical protein n=1 Tax=Cellulomonas sp. SG140 TaxID=2976536 RepID=UPI0021E7AE2D|nr:hypothetical protein [Cellulomonas sp. SG140]
MSVFTTLHPTVQVAIVTGIVTLLGYWFQRMRSDTKALRKDMAATKYHVANDHTTNLRDDVDRAIAGIDQLVEGQKRTDEILRQHSLSLGGIRDDARFERQERILLGKRLDDFIAARPHD